MAWLGQPFDNREASRGVWAPGKVVVDRLHRWQHHDIGGGEDGKVIGEGLHVGCVRQDCHDHPTAARRGSWLPRSLRRTRATRHSAATSRFFRGREEPLQGGHGKRAA